jgi:transposase-like protein
MMTQSEYLETSGIYCPHCNSTNLEASEMEVGAGVAWQDIKCKDCGEEYQDTYVLTGFASTNK